MKVLFFIALRHILDRKRQSFVSLLGIILGVAFFLAVSSMMKGSENDFMKRLVDNSPHITIVDEYREPRVQPVETIYKNGATEISNLLPVTETRGIRNQDSIFSYLNKIPGLRSAPVLAGQALVNFAGKDFALTLNGMNPWEITGISTIESYMIEGSINDLIGYADGIVIGSELAKDLSIKKGDNISISSTAGVSKTFKVLGIFRTGRQNYDKGQAYISLKRAQSLFNRTNRINNIIIKLPDATLAREIAKDIEDRHLYKSISWQETSEDLMSTFKIRNTIMTSVVSAVLVVAAFGIFNVISTVVMEKYKDIAILKAMGFYPSDIKKIFLIQGVILGVIGSFLGVPLGMLFMSLLGLIRFKPPGASQMINMPIDWGMQQFLIAITFAMCASIFAGYFPSRKAGKVQPVDILRGSI
jgi:lipoprotein-releasing system permease protein